jgi:integrase
VSEEDNSRQGRGGDSDTAMARTGLVASPSTDNIRKSGARKKFRNLVARFSDEEKELETPTGGVDYVKDFLQTISPEEYRNAMRWILEIALTNELDIQVILKYIKSFGRAALRKKLHGWLLFQKFCEQQQITIESIIQQDPVKIISRFILYLQKHQVKSYIIQDAKYATSTLFEDILGKLGSGKNKILSALIIPDKLHIPHKKKYNDIWDISVLLNFYRKQPINSELSDFDIMIKSAILILVFTACRQIEVVNILVESIFYKSETESILLPTLLKQQRSQMTNLQIQKLKDADSQICPVAATLEWLARRKTLDKTAPPTFLMTKTGKAMLDAQSLAIAIRAVLTAAGVPTQYSAYSIKHATISALYNLGFSTTEINIFTGHSESADTAPKYYLKSLGNWPGHKLAVASSRKESGMTVVPDSLEQ